MRSGPGLLIVDVACPKPYSARTLREVALGGTEATVVRIATGLARGRQVTVAQRGRSFWERVGGVDWIPYEHKKEREAPVENVVVIRSHKILKRLRRRHPDARLYLWMHCFPGMRLRTFGRAAVEADATVVAVSDHHRRALRAFLEEHDPKAARAVRIITLHNPIDDALRPDDTPVDRDKLVFLSSPHKGLEQVATVFERARQRLPKLKLYVANPGYLDWQVRLPEAMVPLGKLPHAEAMRHTRSAFCLFYPQSRFAETFGLVFAEANALGTPVLAHPIGAAEEVLAQDPSQLIDAEDPDAVLERLVQWRQQGRPKVRADFRFGLEPVLRGWEGVLERGAVPRGAMEPMLAEGGPP